MLELSREAPDLKIHSLKCWPVFFEAVASGRKKFEVRRNDRMFAVKDFLRLNEWHPPSGEDTSGGYTGAYVMCLVTMVLKLEDLPEQEVPLIHKNTALLGIEVMWVNQRSEPANISQPMIHTPQLVTP